MLAAMDTDTQPEQAFLFAFRGSFTSALRWHHLDALWGKVRSRPEGWYLYAVGETPPAVCASAEDCAKFVAELDALLRSEHQEDYCGIVYADDLAEPSLIKVYDPNNLGVVCGFSANPPLPGWVLSRLPPADLPTAQAPPAGRRRWWRRLLGAD